MIHFTGSAAMVALAAATAITAVTGLVPTRAEAQGYATLGTLTCRGGGGVGLILGSMKTYRCAFEPTGRRAIPEDYTATVTKIGLDIGVTAEATMVWTVLASSADIEPGFLTGTYSGASADASVGIGGGAKALIGGSNSSIILQPLSIQGQTGLNLAVGVASMELR